MTLSRLLPRVARAAAAPFGTALLVLTALAPHAAADGIDPAPRQSSPHPLPRVATDQPFASYWFPNELLTWSPATDPDAPYNRSHTPLRDRFLNAIQVNAHARANEARVCPLDIFWATSGNPSQGSLGVNYFAFNYWQYTDVMVFWGGSAGEGLILAPNPGVIDAAHKNGVPVLGTIFFPPAVYGGNIQWVHDLVQKTGSTFPVADKLIEAAEYYGFDGYFVNQETGGGDATLAGQLIEFMEYFQANSDLQLMWYDAMTESGAIAWQEQLNSVNDRFFQDGSTLVSQKMFLDFGWNATDLTTSRTNAQALGRSEYDLFAGVDVQANGYNTVVTWANIFPNTIPHVTSLGLYVPSWTYHSSTGLQDFYARANRMWVGANRDPSFTTTTSNWRGIAHYIPAQSVINDFPFVTNFCTGQGYDFYVDGQKLSPADWSGTGWNNLGLQDVLPTWRWIVESTGTKLYPEMDWTDAFYGGNCLKVSGDLLADNNLKLYKTEFPVSGSTHARVAFKTGSVGPTQMSLGVALASDPQTYVLHDVGAATSTGWNEADIDLGAHAGDTILGVSLAFTANAMTGYVMKVGRLTIEDGTLPPPSPPTNLVIENRSDDGETVTLRLRWGHSPSDVVYYNVYRRNPDLSLTYLGGTPNNAYFVPEVPYAAGDSLVTVEVEAVGQDFAPSTHATTTFLWNTAPSVATSPSPGDGAANVFRNAVLGWSPGTHATSHDVFFGTGSPPPFVSNEAAPSFAPGDLDAMTTYHWRVDEVNSVGTTTGTEWSFTTGNAFADTAASALDFDGTDDLVDCGNASSLRVTGSAITLEAILRADAWRTNVWDGSILNKEQNGTGSDKGYMLRAGNNGQLSFNLGSGSWHELLSPTAAMTTGTFHHVAGTYDGATMRLYIDGTEVASTPAAFSIADASVNLLLGNSQGNPGRVFHGVLDEVRIWNVARSGDQIRARMSTQLPAIYYATADSGLVGYWRLNEGMGQVAGDLTPNGNHGRLGSTVGADAQDPLWVSVQDFPTAVPGSNGGHAPSLRFALHANLPNPFRGETRIGFDLPAAANVGLVIYDVQGRKVRTIVDGFVPAGSHVVEWDGRDSGGRAVASGVYLCRIESGGKTEMRKLVRLR